MLYDLAAFGIIVFLMRPCAAELSVVTCVGPYWCPISSSVVRNGAAVLQLQNSAAVSASDAEVMTCLIIFDIVMMALLLNDSSLCFVM